LRKSPPRLPEVDEPRVVRHYTRLSSWNHGIDSGFYPLGSCTMKYNPRINEELARLDGFAKLHPCLPESMCQGALELMWRLEQMLCEVTGMMRFTLQPAAGAHGELCGVKMIRAYHRSKGKRRHKVLIPDTAHGTNPASCKLAGFDVVEIKSSSEGILTPEAVSQLLDDDTAAIMVTNPNTLGLFEKNLAEIAEMMHGEGALVYCDGANLNSMMGVARPGDMGVDVLQVNLHKTFSTPHGGGGPGAGPVGVSERLEPFLPVPMVEKRDDTYFLDFDRPQSIGRMKSFYGNFAVMVRAYAYLREMGAEGLKRATQLAVLNANYLRHRLSGPLKLAYDRPCLHEVVFSDESLDERGITTLDLAKRLLDYGMHPPTIYFPLVVHGALMMEPTETESPETLDEFATAVEAILAEAERDPELVRTAPHNTPVGRLDEVRAARRPVLKYPFED
ncbi:MAG: glycine dehydrogenase subunit 2, partial [Deltaproteobacteria bacterium]